MPYRSDGGDGAAGVGPGHCLEPRFKWQGQSGDMLRGRTRHGIEDSFGDLTRIPQCDECLLLSWIVGGCWGGGRVATTVRRHAARANMPWHRRDV